MLSAPVFPVMDVRLSYPNEVGSTDPAAGLTYKK